MSTFSKKMAAVAFGLLLAWLVLEVALRLLYPALPYTLRVATRDVYVTPFGETRLLPERAFAFHRTYQFVAQPYLDEMQYPDSQFALHVTTKPMLDPNSPVGFRVPSPDWEPRWPVDVVVLGDSFTFCWTRDYADCWVHQLDARYALSVVNLGLISTGSLSHRNVLWTFGMPFEPRVVIWQWYGNDFYEDYEFAVYNGEISGEAVYFDAPPAPPLVNMLRRYSMVYIILDVARTYGAQQQEYVPHVVSDAPVPMVVNRVLNKRLDMSTPENAWGWAQTKEALLQARETLETAQTPLVVLLVPTKEVVYRRWTEAELGATHLDKLAEGRRMMLDFCQEAELHCLDALPALRARAEAGESLYWADDIHLNPAGNAALAEEVWAYLETRGWMKHGE